MAFGEIAGVVFGTAGLAPSTVSLVRTVANDRKNEMLKLSQRRLELLNKVAFAEASLIRARRILQPLRRDLAAEGRLEVAPEAEKDISLFSQKIEGLRKTRVELGKGIPTDEKGKGELEELFGKAERMLSSYAADLAEAQAEDFANDARDHVALTRMAAR